MRHCARRHGVLVSADGLVLLLTLQDGTMEDDEIDAAIAAEEMYVGLSDDVWKDNAEGG